MKELTFPFDSEAIIQNKRKLKRKLLESNDNFIDKKIAILGGSTTNDIKLTLELFLLDQGIKPTFYESEYNRWYQDGLFKNPELEEFHPDVIYICTTNRNIDISRNLIELDLASVNDLIENEYEKYLSVWKNISLRYHCPIIQNNFEMPSYRLMGNRDAWDAHGMVNILSKLNLKFYEYAQANDDFFICDINYISADYGLSKWQDASAWYNYKYAMSLNAIPYLAFNVSNIIKSIFGKNKKGFVLDLDNTLWGGEIGEDGVDNIVLGPEEAEGQAYLEFQQYIKSHQQLGIILNIDSKNDYENAIAGINHPDSVFSTNDFISIKSNWAPKNDNFRAIANELGLLPESLVFIDDNPAERHIITEQFPGVSVPEIGRATDYIRIIDRSGFFETTYFSKEDMARNEMYKGNIERATLEASFGDYTEYLQSLNMVATIHTFEPVYMARIAQLTNKSNQFNLTTKRYTQNEIEKIAKDENYIAIYGKLSDRFGDNGVVSVIIGLVKGEECHIDLWIMSCRVLKRDMEFAMLDNFVQRCKDQNINTIIGYYYPTPKNNMVRDHYEKLGFTKIYEDDDGNSKWELKVENYVEKNHVIQIVTEK